MATEAQVEANRANARKSTGPRTPEGKEKASQNSLKHGLFAREGAIRGEDEGGFQEYRENLLSQLIPGTPLEEDLAERVVDLSWRLKRAARDQEKAFVVLYEKQTAGVGEALEPAQRDAAIGWMIVEDFSQEAVLDRLLRYERRIESSMYRALNELRRVHDQAQKARQETRETLERWKEEDWEAKKRRMFASSPLRAGSEDVSSLKCQMSSQASPAANPLGPLTSNSTLETFGPTPTAQSEMCKTNPISDGGTSRQGGYTPIFRPRR